MVLFAHARKTRTLGCVSFTSDASKCIVWPMSINNWVSSLKDQLALVNQTDIFQIVLTRYFYQILHKTAQFAEFKFAIIGIPEDVDIVVIEVDNVQRVLFSDEEVGFLAAPMANIQIVYLSWTTISTAGSRSIRPRGHLREAITAPHFTMTRSTFSEGLEMDFIVIVGCIELRVSYSIKEHGRKSI